ncbi:hypothetical protein NP493_509g01003 [Ridgeia piscesae]|uniref:G protein pathway suppressor 2 n=1 Tax=Ridgeia piscesae TaxID=27915 RepID=A0AAD9KXB8_RIDPI|nr:hypothetical protein NP493_509g01003 [Ridgeia piscesae]
MPTSMIERPKMTCSMYQALKRHIMNERNKKKQEQEHDEALERQKKEKELRRKKEAEDSLTLEQTKDQISQLQHKMEQLKQEKHELFSQLKKVLHQEDESRKRAQMKDHSELLAMPQQYHTPTLPMPGHPIFMPGGPMSGRPVKYMPLPHQQYITGVKRQRSPSPPPTTSAYAPYPGGKYPTSAYGGAVKPEAYPPTGGVYGKAVKTETGVYPQQTYVTSSGHPYPQTPPQSQPTPLTYQVAAPQGGGKYPMPGQSAFTSYPNHYAHQQKQDHYPPGFRPVSRMPAQSSYLMSPTSAQDHTASPKMSSYSTDDKYKTQQMTSQPPPQAMMTSGQVGGPPKGSIVTGYPVRTSGYQPVQVRELHRVFERIEQGLDLTQGVCKNQEGC